MKAYIFNNYKICPTQVAVAIADNEQEALVFVLNKYKSFKKEWELNEVCNLEKGLLFWGDNDC